MGRGFPLVYKFDNSKPMGETISNAISYSLRKNDLLHVLPFDNRFVADEEAPLDKLWH